FPKSTTNFEYDTNSGSSGVYDSDIMTKAGSNSLGWDESGNMTTGTSATFEYNYDDKLRSATIGSVTVTFKYDPMGNRVYMHLLQC
ncbi:MAG: hypothetical protein ABIG61_01230, partial [Planctomycetota bacterium]